MKITKRYLKQLIREELAYVFEDMSQHNTGMTDPDNPLMTTEPPDDRYNRERIAWETRADRARAAAGEHAGEGGMTHGDVPMTQDPAEHDEDARWGMQRRSALQGTDAIRKEINRLHSAGEIDKNTWRQARRALYKGDDGASALQIVGSARASKFRSDRKRGILNPSPGGMADYYAQNMED